MSPQAPRWVRPRSAQLRWSLWSLLIAAGVSAPTPLHGIEIQPTPGQISATVERGRAAAAQGIAPDQLHVWFGSEKDLAPRGFIMTKLGSLLVMANHLRLRALSPTEQDIAQVIPFPVE